MISDKINTSKIKLSLEAMTIENNLGSGTEYSKWNLEKAKNINNKYAKDLESYISLEKL